MGIQASFIEIKHLKVMIISMNSERDAQSNVGLQGPPQENNQSGGVVDASLRELKKNKSIPQPLIWLIIFALGLSLSVGVMISFAKSRDAKIQSVPLVRLQPTEMYAKFNQDQLRSYFSGVWYHESYIAKMSLSMVDDKFELIIAPASVSGVRYFVRGSFIVDGDVLILEKRNDLGYSFDPDKRWLRYIPISMNNVNIRYELKQRDMIWSISDEEGKYIRGGAHEFFSGKYNSIEWKKH